MYLISIYFDDNTNKIIQQYINQIAKQTGNMFMLDKKVPPHITISSFETSNENKAVEILNDVAKSLSQGTLQWVTVGTFMPYVIYMAPVLNEYLHNISVAIYDKMNQLEDVNISKYYRPFQWFPHTTIGKKLTKEQLQEAFRVIQNQFGMFSGTVTKIGLAKTNPYNDVALFELKEVNVLWKK